MKNNQLIKYAVVASLTTANPILLAQGDNTTYVYGQAETSKNEVSAFKTDTPLKDIPQSLSVFTEEQIKEQGLQSIGDIVDYTPGFNNSQGEGHRDAVVFRGVRSTADFFVNGIRDDVQYYRPLYNVEKVEVLRGPNALYFGRGGAGGVINRVMKKAEIGQSFNQAEASINTFGEVRSSYDTNVSLNDKSALRLNLHYDNLRNHRDFYYGDQVGINPTYTYQFNEDTSLELSYEYNNHERFIDRGIPSDPTGDPVRALDDIVFGDAEDNFSTLQAHTFKATLNHQFSDNWKGSLTAFYGDYNKLYQNYFASDYNPANDNVTIDGYRDTTDRTRFLIGGDLVGEFETGILKHKLVLGTEYIRTSNDNDRFNAVWDTTGVDKEDFIASSFSLRNGSGINAAGNPTVSRFEDLNDNTELTLDVFSFYLQDEIAVGDKLDVILGARFDNIDQDFDNLVTGTSLSQSDSQISPRFGLVYKPIEDLSLYASYSESFVPSNGNQFASISDRLDPDEHVNLEAGIKYNLTDSLAFTTSVFQIDTTVQDLVGPNLIEEEEAEINGFEAQLQGYLTEKWYISAGYSYLDGETTDGDRPRELPENSFSLWNSYQVTDKLNLGLGLIYQDDTFSNNGGGATLPSYVRADLAAHYDLSEDKRISLHIENLFDTNYFPDSHTANNISVGAPISARLAFSTRF